MIECPICKSVEAEPIDLKNGSDRPYFCSPRLDYLHLLVCAECGVVYLDGYQLEQLKGKNK